MLWVSEWAISVCIPGLIKFQETEALDNVRTLSQQMSTQVYCTYMPKISTVIQDSPTAPYHLSCLALLIWCKSPKWSEWKLRICSLSVPQLVWLENESLLFPVAGISCCWVIQLKRRYFLLPRSCSTGSPVFSKLLKTNNRYPTLHIYLADFFLAAACGGTFHMERGAFNSPSFPEPYPLNVECVWNIPSSPGNRLQLSFT